ncbi:transmembrane Fragile-X-F protein [Planococcus sp. ANT_H30]|uniref:transmembrane Fragile-X-F protein n=1 Tax=Planococcus sp. ANT_H30 TaxID=2597347 RepID=UPI0011ED755F|nr:transmembrane Fragile-X-F protein [Planococcus sp. ANT_H30]KAA0957715.1 transmembrane Fragile-X-F protein [Planococcus sp. ANT_H30]
MGFLEVLTIIFVVLQLTGVIAWSWWLVFLPLIIAVGIYVVWLLIVIVIAGSTHKKVMKEFDKGFWE